MATLFLGGDVMLGRGVDQILRHPSRPRLHEPWVRDARDYVALAEGRNGPVPRRAGPGYPWGTALAELAHAAPDLRLVNLETSVTRSDERWPGKGIHYRMHPDNADCLAAAGIDLCVLANNHVLDWGRPGLLETLETLEHLGIATAGAGRNRDEARRPAALATPAGGRVLVLAAAFGSSGVPEGWAAGPDTPGVFLASDDPDDAAEMCRIVAAERRAGDVAVASLHWGGNWGYEVPGVHRRFAHRLIDGGFDVVYGHSSHHPRPIETYRDRLILYGCGDLLNDYEGISGHEEFRGDLSLMYFATLHAGGALERLRMFPLRIRKLSLETAALADAAWLREVLARESGPFGTHLDGQADGSIVLRS